MKNKRSLYVWIIIVLVILGIISSLSTIISDLLNIKTLLTSSLLSTLVMNIIYFGLNIVEVWLLIVYLLKLYNLNVDVVKWTNIIFVFIIVKSFYSIFFAGVLFILILIPWIIGAIISLIVWKTFVKHLKKIQKLNN